MKRKGFKAFWGAIALVTLTVCSLAFVSSAEEQHMVTTAKIGEANVAFNGQLRLAFTVESTLLTPDDADLGIMVWDSSVTEPTVKNCKYVNLNEKSQNGTAYYLVRPTSLSDIATEFYVAACYKLGEEIKLAEKPFLYSIERYFTYNLASPITEERAFIYAEYLELAKDAGATDITAVKTNGGYVGYNKITFGGALGQTVILRADAKNSEDKYFLVWKDASGKVISNDRITSVTVEADGITEYTAIYGDRDLSAYSATYDFESFESGLIDITYPVEDNISKIESGYNSEKTPLFNGSKSYDGLKLNTYKSLTKVGQNQYVYSTGHDFYIVDSATGGKEMLITNGHQARGASATFSDIYEAYAVGAEVDVQYNTAKSGGFVHISLTVVDKNGKTVTLRTNLTTNGTSCTFYAEGEGSSTHFYLQKKVDLRRGNVLSFRAELDRAGEAIDIYANGVFLEKVSLNSYASYKKITDKAESDETATTFDLESLTISTIAVCGISSSKDDITIDNVTFICGDPIITENKNEEGAK